MIMGMFLHYQDISKNYTPNNICKEYTTPRSYTKLDGNDLSKPYELMNAKNELEGYFWNYGDVLNLEFNITGEITVESDAVILYVNNETPFNIVAPIIGQRAYNVADLKSWTCVSVEPAVWREDIEFTYPEVTDRSIYISADDYLKNKQFILRLYNFRYEQIYETTHSGTSKLIFPITKDLSNKLVKGIYYCSLTCVSEDTTQSLFGPSDCKLLVK
jgi:hypothetical protein